MAEDQVLNAEEVNQEISNAQIAEDEANILRSTISELSRAYIGMGNRAERRRMSKQLKATVRKRRRNEKA